MIFHSARVLVSTLENNRIYKIIVYVLWSYVLASFDHLLGCKVIWDLHWLWATG